MQLFVIYLKFRFSWAPCVFNCYIWHLYVQFSPYIQKSIEIEKTWLSFRLRKEDALLFSSRLLHSVLLPLPRTCTADTALHTCWQSKSPIYPFRNDGGKSCWDTEECLGLCHRGVERTYMT